MKILVHDYAGHPFQVQLSRSLASHGHSVLHAYAGGLLTPRGDLQASELDPPQLRFKEVPMSAIYRMNKYKFVKRRRYEINYGKELAKLVREDNPDIVISGNTPSEPQWSMIREANRLGIPVVNWVQDFYSLAVRKLLSRRFPLIGVPVAWWYESIDRRCFKNSSATVAITPDFVPTLKAFGAAPKSIEIIPNWAPIDKIPVRLKQNSWAELHGLMNKFVFLYSGTIAMKHNPELLVALARDFHGESAVRVVVVSEGPGAEHLTRRKAELKLDNLELLPFQPFTDFPDVLATGDVLISVLESDAGVFSVPSKVLSYFCAGRPLLGAMPMENLASRMIVDRDAGLVVNPWEIERFVASARQLYSNASARVRLGENALKYAEETFDIESITDRFESLFKRVIVSR